MTEKMLVCGDFHLHWQAAKVAFDYARKEKIDNIITLGDEGSEFQSEELSYEKLYHEYRLFRNENPIRNLVCIIGNDTARVPKDLLVNYVDARPDGSITGPSIYQKDNIIAIHCGRFLLKEYSEFIDNYKGNDPLIIFHGHSHSMGVLDNYEWLEKFVHYLKDGPQIYRLEPNKTYWVNPGGNCLNINNQGMANMVIYDPSKQEITLQTIPYNPNKIKSTYGINSR